MNAEELNLMAGDTLLRCENWRAVINCRGAVVREFGWFDDSTFQRVIDGYRDSAELAAFDGYRSGILAPWSNRIAGGTYSFQGEQIRPESGPMGEPNALHGLFALREFEISQQSETSVSLRSYRAADSRYPWALEVIVTYTLSSGALVVEISAQNLAESTAPVGLGWHPYFATDNEWQVRIPAQLRIDVDQDLIPLEGGFTPLKGEYRARTERDIDTAYTALQASVAHLETSYYRLEMYANLPLDAKGAGIFHLYTGDFLTQRRYESVALEPCQFMTDAFNRPALAAEVSLAPQAQRKMIVKLDITPKEISGK